MNDIPDTDNMPDNRLQPEIEDIIFTDRKGGHNNKTDHRSGSTKLFHKKTEPLQRCLCITSRHIILFSADCPARLVHSDSRNQTHIFPKFASRSQTFPVSNTEHRKVKKGFSTHPRQRRYSPEEPGSPDRGRSRA